MALAARLGSWAADLAQRRQGVDPQAVVLARGRLYILPTRFGTALALLVFAMLLGSLNYGASLGFALTFLLTGVGLVAMLHCHQNLVGATVRFAGAAPVFAGDLAEFRLALDNSSRAMRYELELARGNATPRTVDLAPDSSTVVAVTAPAPRRGWLALGRVTVATQHPGRLFRAWTWVHMDARCLVYPALAAPGRPLPEAGREDGARGRPRRGDDDFAGLRTAAPGDPPQRIAWKAFARSDTLLTKQFASSGERPCLLEWDALPELEAEARLSQLARWCVDAARAQRSFALRLPHTTLPLGSGPHHLAACLQALALAPQA